MHFIGLTLLKMGKPFGELLDRQDEYLPLNKKRDDQDAKDQNDQRDIDPLPELRQGREYKGSVVNDLHDP